MKILASAALALVAGAVPAHAAEISTHVLDLARGIGGRDIPVTLARRAPDGRWEQVAGAKTDADGRVRSFGDPAKFTIGTYRLNFDMGAYPDVRSAPFFPEIVLTFRVADPSTHYHVPVVVSPFGYSTYRGN